MKKLAIMATLVVVASLSLVSIVAASGITVAPFTWSGLGLGTFTPGQGPAAQGKWVRVGDDFQLHLEKNVPTTAYASAGAQINGVRGLSTGTADEPLVIGFTVDSGQCGAGAPRFNVKLEGEDGTVFLGCAYGGGSTTKIKSFTAGNSYGGVSFPTGKTIESISIVFDEQGWVNLDDILVGGDNVGSPRDNGAN